MTQLPINEWKTRFQNRFKDIKGITRKTGQFMLENCATYMKWANSFADTNYQNRPKKK